MKNNILYIGLVLNKNSQELLKQLFSEYIIHQVKRKSKDWENYKIICHHMTISFYTDLDDEILDYSYKNIDKIFDINSCEYGFSDKAIALKVNTICHSKNKLKHITMAVNTDNGGNAVDSNYIKDWYKMEPINLKGSIEFFYKNN